MRPLPLAHHVSRRQVYSILKTDAEESYPTAFVGSEVCQRAYSIERSGFPFTVVEFIESGNMEIEWNSVSSQMTRGSFICYGPESHIRLRVRSDMECCKHFLAFLPESLSEITALPTLQRETMGKVVHDIPVLTVLKYINLMTAFSGDNRGWDILQPSVESFFRFILSELKTSPSNPTPPRDSTYDRVARFVSENFKTLRSLDEIAEKSGYDASYLCRVYKQSGSSSPYQQLISMKIHYACILLETTQWKVSEIARELCFEDPLHFSRLFKQKVGISPSQYRPALARTGKLELE